MRKWVLPAVVVVFSMFLFSSCDSISPEDYYNLVYDEVENVVDKLNDLNEELNESEIDFDKVDEVMGDLESAIESGNENINNLGKNKDYASLQKEVLYYLENIQELVEDDYQEIIDDYEEYDFYEIEKRINDKMEDMTDDLFEEFDDFSDEYELDDEFDIEIEKLSILCFFDIDNIVGAWEIESADLSNLDEFVTELAQQMGMEAEDLEEMKTQLKEGLAEELVGEVIEFREDKSVKFLGDEETEAEWSYDSKTNIVTIKDGGDEYDMLINSLDGDKLDVTLKISDSGMDLEIAMTMARQ